jgi:hypothetical protein
MSMVFSSEKSLRRPFFRNLPVVRVHAAEDLLRDVRRADMLLRFAHQLGQPVVEHLHMDPGPVLR